MTVFDSVQGCGRGQSGVNAGERRAAASRQ